MSKKPSVFLILDGPLEGSRISGDSLLRGYVQHDFVNHRRRTLFYAESLRRADGQRTAVYGGATAWVADSSSAAPDEPKKQIVEYPPTQLTELEDRFFKGGTR